MITIADIQELISAYIANKDLQSFSTKFAELSYDIEQTGDAKAVSLAYSVESLLAAATAGVCSEDALFEAIKSLSPSLLVVYYQSTLVPANQTLLNATDFGKVKLASFGIAPSMGFGSIAVLPDISQTNTDLPPWQLLVEVQ